MDFLKNCWYMGGWSSEIADGAVLSRHICDVPIAFYRHEERVHAVVDTCPHRFAPLSRGKLVNGALVCGYHGLAFDGTGACVHNPHGPVTRQMRVRAFPAIERHKALWIWMGDPADADPALIPDFSFQDEALDTAISFGYIHGEADYRLYVDNIMDLSHVDFLHADTLGGGSIVGTKQEIRDDDRSLTVRWSLSGVAPSPLHISLGSFPADAKLDRFTEVTWYPPGAMILTSAFGAVGAADHEFSKVFNANIMVPETSRTMHYFYSSARTFKTDDAAFNDIYAVRRDHIFQTEDSPMIDAVQRRMGQNDLFELRPLLLKIDDAAVRVRRKMAVLLEAEHAAPEDVQPQPAGEVV